MRRMQKISTEKELFIKTLHSGKIQKVEGGCWNWMASLTSQGYGKVQVGGSRNPKGVLAHRISYEIYIGGIPDGMCVCHKCDNRRCVNPDHFFLGTNTDNMHDMIKKGRGVVGARGESSRAARLTEESVKEGRRLRSQGLSFGRIAKIFGVDESTMRYAVQRRTWTHI